MERPSDTPFFVEKPDNSWRRQHFGLIHGRGEEVNGEMDLESQYMLKALVLFLHESGLGRDDYDKSIVDAGLLEEKFTDFIKKESEDTSSEEQKLLTSMTFSGVANMCEIWAQTSRRVILSMPLDSPDEICQKAFFDARYYSTLNNIMQEAVSMTASQKAASRNIVLVPSNESPVEAP
ncbi:MAG TPA: hypothetical protein VJ065_03135 [Patescibacteria group bacterium]|nr:hypothetical protein [Patescibacteria group bacterium]